MYWFFTHLIILTLAICFKCRAVLSSMCVQVLGGIAGKNNKSEFYAPCRTNKYPREIPALPWYRKTVPQVFDSRWDLSTYVLGSHYLPFCEPSDRGKSQKNGIVGKISKSNKHRPFFCNWQLAMMHCTTRKSSVQEKPCACKLALLCHH